MRNLVKENRSNGFHLFNEPKVSLSMSLQLRQRVELLAGRGRFSNKSTSKEATIKLVSILEKICMVICHVLGSLCDPKQEQKSKYEIIKPRT
jgi:hypothetical protein